MLLAPHEESALVVRGGCFGRKVVVLCCERVPRGSLEQPPTPQPADYFGAGGGGRGPEANLEAMDQLLPWDELRVVCHFDERMPRLRSTRRPSAQANCSDQMASALLGTRERTPLTGAHMPRVGQHVILPEGGTDSLVGGLAALAKEQRFKLHGGIHTQWTLAFELEMPGTGKVSSAADALERLDVAVSVLRDNACSSSFRQYERGGPAFAAVQGDVDGGTAAVAHVLAALQEACAAVTTGTASGA